MAVLLALYRFPRYYNRRVRNPGSQRRCLIFIIRIGFPKAKASTNSSRGAGANMQRGLFLFFNFFIFYFFGGENRRSLHRRFFEFYYSLKIN